MYIFLFRICVIYFRICKSLFQKIEKKFVCFSYKYQIFICLSDNVDQDNVACGLCHKTRASEAPYVLHSRVRSLPYPQTLD
jgi:hypothetical protein